MSGEKLYNVLGIVFEVTKKRYYFEIKENENYKIGEKIVVETSRGREIGVVYSNPMKLEERFLVLPLKPILKKATEEEISEYNNLKIESDNSYNI